MQTIGIACRKDLEKHEKVFRRLVDHLQKSGKKVLLEKRVADILVVKQFDELVLGKSKVDLILVLGGDGTILRVLSKMKSLDTKLFGINMGHLGFLSEIPPVQIAKTMDKIFAGKYDLDTRMLLDIVLERNGKIIKRYHALNEVAITQGSISRLIHLKTKVDGRKLANYKADGLLVATPTGSTAYNLAAGGPIVHPSLNAFILTPICPHSFSQKPIVIPDDKKIEITVACDFDTINMTVDGQQNVLVKEGDIIKIKKNQPVQFIRLLTESYFTNIRNKLGWGERVEKIY